MSEIANAPHPKVLNRWFVVLGAILIQLALGAIYAWSVFTKKLTAEGGEYVFTAAQAAWVFSAGLATFALVMLFAGRWQAKIGPRPVAVVGGLTVCLGYVLGGFIGDTFIEQLVCIGILGGAGIGLGYVIPIAVCVKWFPDKKGMITGLAVAGFGFGATIWVKLAGEWFGGLLNTTNVFGLPGVQSVFVIYGITFGILVLLGSIVMVNPPEGWKPAGWNPEAAGTAQSKPTGGTDFLTSEMARTWQYWSLFLMFVGSALAGLMVIYCIRLFGTDSLLASGAILDADEAGKVAGTAMAWLAIFNGLGRIFWGTISDRLGRQLSLILMCFAQGIMMLIFYQVGGSKMGLIVGASIIGFNFGGNFALYAAATADYFGNKNVGLNYPWVFLAYGFAGIAGPQVAGIFKDLGVDRGVEAWWPAFVIAGIACLVAGGIGLVLKAPQKQPSPVMQGAEPQTVTVTAD